LSYEMYALGLLWIWRLTQFSTMVQL
jgi:hypothetical protein